MVKEDILFITVVQILTIYNALKRGWKVRKISDKKYELSKDASDVTNFNLDSFIDEIFKTPVFV